MAEKQELLEKINSLDISEEDKKKYSSVVNQANPQELENINETLDLLVKTNMMVHFDKLYLQSIEDIESVKDSDRKNIIQTLKEMKESPSKSKIDNIISRIHKL